jgi:uncharacterized protein (TIGR00661 family)
VTDKKCILISPLDWGLGHASRDSRIIQCLSARGHEIIIAGSGHSLDLLKTEFPDKEFLSLPSSTIKYDRKIPAWLMILTLIPGWIMNLSREHRILKKIVRNRKIDLVISDARYGLSDTKVPSVLITHQLSMKMPFKSQLLERMISYMNKMAIRRFTACWIPDYDGFPNLSGALSHIPEMPENAIFIGPLSRFDEMDLEADHELKYEVVAVVSGPEPQRSVFEEMLYRQLTGLELTSLIICGRPDMEEKEQISGQCARIPFLTGKKLAETLVSAHYIICRSGYSTIMDLVSLKKTACLVPTPGQTEQEYLAKYLSEIHLFPCLKQKDFNVQEAISALENYDPHLLKPDRHLFYDAINALENTGYFNR